MKRYIMIFLAAVLFVMSLSARENLDRNGRIAKDFKARRELVADDRYFDVFETLSGSRLQAMQFLYAYMPITDIADYRGEFHLQNVDYALKARAEMPWGKQVPVREFMHFVLPVRVNNENMDSSRAVFYTELRSTIGATRRLHTPRATYVRVRHWQPCALPMAVVARSLLLLWLPCVPWVFLPVRCILHVGRTPTTTTPGLRLGLTASGIFLAHANPSLCSTLHGSMHPHHAVCSCTQMSSAVTMGPRRC